MLSSIGNVIKTQGIKGLYRGWGALAVRDLPFDAIEFPLYEFLKTTVRRHVGGRDLYTWENSLCGSLAGGLTAAITTPLDVIKTRIMTSPETYTSMSSCLVKIISEEGPQVQFTPSSYTCFSSLHIISLFSSSFHLQTASLFTLALLYYRHFLLVWLLEF